ncbi:MAG: hypothetical protein NTX15_09555 [Candidatus Kapabacteria bacterium]|nr:hypothetical protein [Candidatus Kapabacteria bacterium]
MRNWTVVLVLCCSLTAVSAQIPFGMKLLSPRSRIETLLKERGLTLMKVPPVDGVAPGVYTTDVDWNGTAFDTMFVWFTTTSERVNAISFVRKCSSSKAPLIVAELTDVVSHTYGDPSFSDETSARWEKGNEAAISMGPYAENDAVWVRFDLAPLFYRLSTTKLSWPLELPLITDRDEIMERMKDSCRKVTEEGDQLFTSAGCSCF